MSKFNANDRNKIVKMLEGKRDVSSEEEALWFLAKLVECQDIDIQAKLALASGQKTLKNSIMTVDLCDPTKLSVLLNVMDAFMKDWSGIKKNIGENVIETVRQTPLFIFTLEKQLKDGKISKSNEVVIAWFIVQTQKKFAATDSATQFAEVLSLVKSLLASQPDVFLELKTTFFTHLQAVTGNQFDLGLEPIPQSNATSTPVPKTYQELKDLAPQHNNDFPLDYRKISIFPTVEELNTKNNKFRVLSIVESSSSTCTEPALMLDRHFRLLREDMLAPLREELTSLLDPTAKQKSKLSKFERPMATSVSADKGSGKPYVTLRFDMPTRLRDRVKDMKSKREMQTFFESEGGKKVFPIDSVLIFVTDQKVVHVGCVVQRDPATMAHDPKPYQTKNQQKDGGNPKQQQQQQQQQQPNLPPPTMQIGVSFVGSELTSILPLLCDPSRPRFISDYLVQARTSFFSYQPVLECLQGMTTVPFKEELLGAHPRSMDVAGREQYRFPRDIALSLQSDASQLESAMNAMQTRISVIQGPPGTGKTYIGVQLVRALKAAATPDEPLRILCLCYTNHALDNFLEALIDDAKVDINDIVRLGKSPKMKEQFKSRGLDSLDSTSDTRAQKSVFASCKSSQESLTTVLTDRSQGLSQSYWGIHTWSEVKEFLGEYSDDPDAQKYVAQLSVPEINLKDTDGMTKVGKKGKALSEDDAWKRWYDGSERPSYIADVDPNLWRLDKLERHSLIERWRRECVHEFGKELQSYMKQMQDVSARLASLQHERKMQSLRKAVIIGCTTTSAAKYHELLESAQPSVVLVEEAAEILESHVLTNISSSTKQIIMIGDHKQLRPKLEHYMLRKESNQKIDFDVSLFERLVLNNYPISTLTVQHRMRPEISCYVRHMTYPTLADAPRVEGRDNIKGVQCSVAFVEHTSPEASADDRLTMESSSKTNEFEVNMTVAIVKYLLQQGYRYDDIVVLTPYLGQLVKIQEALKNREIGTAVGDLDKRDVAQNAAVLGRVDFSDNVSVDSDVSSSISSNSPIKVSNTIRVATVDNYQGEEAKIIIASMVRSNEQGDIGFLSGPERINVLFSRARDGFFILGNGSTLRQCRNSNGRAMWTKLLNEMANQKALFSGFPTRCERHQLDRCLTSVEEFKQYARNGGCDQPCNAVIPSCPLKHKCTLICHFGDHDAVRCKEKINTLCLRGIHDVIRECGSDTVPPCTKRITTSKCPEGHQLPAHNCSHQPTTECKVCAKIKKTIAEAEELATKEEEAATDRLMREEAVTVHKSAKLRSEMKKLKEDRDRESQRLKQESIDAQLGLVMQERQQLANLSRAPVPVRRTPNSTTGANSVGASSSALSQLTIEANSFQEQVADSQSSSSRPSRTNSDIPPYSPPPSYSSGVTSSEITPRVENSSAVNIPPGKLKRIMKAAYAEDWKNVIQIVNSDGVRVNLDSTEVYDLPHVVMAVLVMANVELAETSSNITDRLYTLHESGENALVIDYVRAMVWKKLKQPVTAVRFARHVMEKCDSSKEFPAKWKENIEELINYVDNMPLVTETQDHGKGKLSESQSQWKEIVDDLGKSPSLSMDVVMKMIGLESIKNVLISQYNRISMGKKGGFPGASNYNTRFDGNPGTGKTTVARLYATFLIEVEILPDTAKVKETTGSELKNGGVSALKKMLEELKQDEGGVIFVDEAYQLNDNQGHAVLDFILANATELRGQYGSIVWVFAGYAKMLDKLFEHNLGLPSRFPCKFVFEDYTDDELLLIFNGLLKTGGRDVNKREVQTKDKPKPPVVNAQSVGGRRPYPVNKTGASTEQVDEWNNKWTWDAYNYRFTDPYGNTSGLGVSGPPNSYVYANSNPLGSQSNPVVDSAGTSWLYDRNTKTWSDSSYPVKRQSHYPGSPKPVPPAVTSKPFTVEDPKWSRIAMKRIGRLRGSVGFGNARSVKNVFDAAVNRHSQRVSKLKPSEQYRQLRFLLRDDVLGPKPSLKMLQSCKALQKLEGMEGLTEVKQSVKQLLDLVIDNSNREDQEKAVLDLALNRVFLGNPGTGKTTVAKLYAEILTHFGMLSKGEVQMKCASDFIGNVMGSSETQTRAILENARGNVLVIDEAYGLNPAKGLNSSNDIYREAVIDTLVEQIQGVPGEDRAVLLLGYRDKMENMMANSNPGLKRRFNLDNAFEFKDYDDNALVRILKAQVAVSDLSFDSPFTAVEVINLIAKKRALPNFGNAGEIQNSLTMAKTKMQTRKAKNPKADPSVLVLSDFESSEKKKSIKDLFAELVGCSAVKTKIEQIEYNIAMAKRQALDVQDRCPFNFIFTGAPGTGKTTVARLMGMIFHKFGLIGSDEVVMKSPSDFSTGYLGQAGKRTNEILCSALGKVLFIDEAYGLAQEHSYMSEVVDELVKCMTDPKFKGNMVIVMAGYEKDMNKMLDTNEGLRSRFTEKVHFEDFSAELICDLILKRIAHFGFEIESTAKDHLIDTIADKLLKAPSFANGRDVITFADKVYSVVSSIFVEGSGEPIVTTSVLDSALVELMKMKNSIKGKEKPDLPKSSRPKPLVASMSSGPPPPVSTATDTAEEKNDEDLPPEPEEHKADAPSAQPYLIALQTILDERGLNNRDGVKHLSTLLPDSSEFLELANEIASRLNISPAEAIEKLKEWQRNQKNVHDQLEQSEKEAKSGKQGQVPIWRCGVCGRADQPFIVCWVQPFIVRYEKRNLKTSN